MHPFGFILFLASSISIIMAVSVVVHATLEWLSPNSFAAVLSLLAGAIVFYTCCILVYRMFLVFEVGGYKEGHRLNIFETHRMLSMAWIIGPLLDLPFPLPLKTSLYRMLGARIGKRSLISGKLADPHLVHLGNDSIIGMDALVLGHSGESSGLIQAKIVIGDRVIIGARSIILPGVIVDDGASVAAGAVVAKYKRIASGEVWAGVPARCIKSPIIENAANENAKEERSVRTMEPASARLYGGFSQPPEYKTEIKTTKITQ